MAVAKDRADVAFFLVRAKASATFMPNGATPSALVTLDTAATTNR
jgi:hypothetical protein